MARVVTTVDGVIGLIEYEIERLTKKLEQYKGSNVAECILLGRRLQMHELLCIIEGLKTTYKGGNKCDKKSKKQQG